MSQVPTITPSMAQTNVISVKLLVDTKGHKVLFAEAGKDFVDFLFSILSCSVGTVINLFTKEGMLGCLGNLYDGIENLSDTYMQPNQKKDSILKPKAPNSDINVPLYLHNVESSASKKWYNCHRRMYHRCSEYMTDDPRATCPECGALMSSPVSYVPPPTRNSIASFSEEGGFVKGLVTYMVMDNLVVKPLSTTSIITMLNKFNIKEVGALEEKVIHIDINEAVKLLKASFQSKTVLTDVFLGCEIAEGSVPVENSTY